MTTTIEWADLPDMWGTDPGNPMWSVPPSDDPYWKDRHKEDHNEEVYWLEREREHWFTVAKSFYHACGGPYCCPFNAHRLLATYTPFFEDKIDEPID